MNDVDRWIFFDGPEPASVRPLLDALREAASPRPTAEEKARALGSFFEALEGRLAGYAAVAPPGVAPPPPVVEVKQEKKAEAAEVAEERLSFEAWAELSLRLIGAGAEERVAALGARGLTAEEWSRLDERYLRALWEDLPSGREDRAAVYARKWEEEMERRSRRLLAGG